jgi:phosphatidylglycerol:prolipoprotein diacylglycerol transferase
VLPALGIAIVFIRLGCFLTGCCFGKVSGTPWAISFPAGAIVYDWHMSAHLIRWPAERSLPVEPLQLYFAFAGLLLYALGRRWQRQKRYDGEVWVKSYLLFFASTLALEFLCQHRLWANIFLSALVAAAVGTVAVVERVSTTSKTGPLTLGS